MAKETWVTHLGESATTKDNQETCLREKQGKMLKIVDCFPRTFPQAPSPTITSFRRRLSPAL